jgi:hypothetical protein
LVLLLPPLVPEDRKIRAMAADVVAPGALFDAGAYEYEFDEFNAAAGSTLGRVHWVIFRS